MASWKNFVLFVVSKWQRRLDSLGEHCRARATFLEQPRANRLESACKRRPNYYLLPKEEAEVAGTTIFHDAGFYPRAHGAPEGTERRQTHPPMPSIGVMASKAAINQRGRYSSTLATYGLPKFSKQYTAKQWLKEPVDMRPKGHVDYRWNGLAFKESIFISWWQASKRLEFHLWGLIDSSLRSGLSPSPFVITLVKHYAYKVNHQGFGLRPKSRTGSPTHILSISLKAKVFQFLRNHD